MDLQVELDEGKEGKAFLGVRFAAVPRFQRLFSERFGGEPGEDLHFYFHVPNPGFEPGPRFRWFGTPQEGDEGEAGPPETST